MTSVYHDISNALNGGTKLLAVLMDPDKITVTKVKSFIKKVNTSIVTHVFVGGSTVADSVTETLVVEIKKYTTLPVILFPGDITQITDKADALLFLSLISGRNSEYLIGKHVASVAKLKKTSLEVIPTGYLLIENGKITSVQKVTNTLPIPRTDSEQIVATAKAGELLGMKLIYLEAGSGALHPVPLEIIAKVKETLNIPLIVGGGIRSKQQLTDAYKFGADLVVIGTAFESDESFFEQLQ